MCWLRWGVQVAVACAVTSACALMGGNARTLPHTYQARSACSVVIHSCEDEYKLFQQLFGLDSRRSPDADASTVPPSEYILDSDASGLTEMIQNLAGCLEDYLRPVILSQTDFTTLAELVAILRSEVLEEHIRPRGALCSLPATVGRISLGAHPLSGSLGAWVACMLSSWWLATWRPFTVVLCCVCVYAFSILEMAWHQAVALLQRSQRW